MSNEQQQISLDALANNAKRSITSTIDQFFDIIVNQQNEIKNLNETIARLQSTPVETKGE